MEYIVVVGSIDQEEINFRLIELRDLLLDKKIIVTKGIIFVANINNSNSNSFGKYFLLFSDNHLALLVLLVNALLNLDRFAILSMLLYIIFTISFL